MKDISLQVQGREENRKYRDPGLREGRKDEIRAHGIGKLRGGGLNLQRERRRRRERVFLSERERKREIETDTNIQKKTCLV